MVIRFYIEVIDSLNNEFLLLILINMFISINIIINLFNVIIKFCINYVLKIMCFIF